MTKEAPEPLKKELAKVLTNLEKTQNTLKETILAIKDLIDRVYT